jgi:acetyltransferase-like isoleucine patch superfamily enzyme
LYTNSAITDFNLYTDRYASGAKPIHIKENVYSGLNTIVLKDAEIGENSIISANSIVIKDIPINNNRSGKSKSDY